MSDKEHAPLSAYCVRALHDKFIDKRKAAALEVEKMVRDFHATDKTSQIKRIIKVVGDFTTSQNPNGRKGGLIALAAVAVALGKDASVYTEDLIHPILSCLWDPDSRIRYFACESLYNVIKAVRENILAFFADVFNVLSRLAADPDQNVKNGSELIDRLLKDIVTETPDFDLVLFMPLLSERINSTNSFARQFIISWISLLDAVPDIDLIIFLPEFLDGLFKILGDALTELKTMCDTILGEFLRSIKSDPKRVDFPAMINILIIHAQATDELVQFTAITWIKEFVQLSGVEMLPYMSGIFTAVLPYFSFDGESRRIQDIKDTATAVNFSLRKLITMNEEGKLYNINVKEEEPSEDALNKKAANPKIDLQSVVDVLIQHLNHNSVQTKVAVLRWIYHLYTNIPAEMFLHIDAIFPPLQNTLSDNADDVVQQCVVVLAEIISSPYGNSTLGVKNETTHENKGDKMSQVVIMSPYYTKFLISLLKSFQTKKNFLEARGSFIIRQLCALLNAQDIYRTLAKILLEESNFKFVSIMVETLNIILLTSSELYELRTQLKELKTEESCDLFQCLYKTWCHNPVATVSLCLLSQNYSHACQLIRVFGNLDVTVEFLNEIDKLVQLIESPIFAFLRLDLLEVPCDQNLVRALYGLLMLLPQSEAFHTLRTRLDCIPSHHLYCDNRNVAAYDYPAIRKDIDFEAMLKQFLELQEIRKNNKQIVNIKNILMVDRELGSL